MNNDNNVNTGKFLLTTLIVWVVNFFGGWLIFGIALDNFYRSNSVHYEGLMREMPNIGLIALSTLTQALLLVFIIYNLARAFTFGRGFVIGAVVTLLISSGFDFFMLASLNLYNWGLVLVDILVSAIFGGFLGGIAGWFIGYRRAPADQRTVS